MDFKNKNKNKNKNGTTLAILKRYKKAQQNKFTPTWSRPKTH